MIVSLFLLLIVGMVVGTVGIRMLNYWEATKYQPTSHDTPTSHHLR